MLFKRVLNEFPLRRSKFFDTGLRIELDFLDAAERAGFLAKFGYPEDMQAKVFATLYLNGDTMAWHSVYVVHDGKWDFLPPTTGFAIPDGVLSAVIAFYDPERKRSPKNAGLIGHYLKDSLKVSSWVPAIVRRYEDGSCKYVSELCPYKGKADAENAAHVSLRVCNRLCKGTLENLEMHLLPGFPINR